MRPISRCLNPKLLQICKQALSLEALETVVKKHLPETIRDACHVGSFNQGRLRLVLDNSVWASELRYLLPQLRDTLRKEGQLYQLSSIQVEIGIENTPTKKKKPNTHRLSQKARETIIEEAESISDPTLRAAFLKLADSKRKS